MLQTNLLAFTRLIRINFFHESDSLSKNICNVRQKHFDNALSTDYLGDLFCPLRRYAPEPVHILAVSAVCKVLFEFCPIRGGERFLDLLFLFLRIFHNAPMLPYK